MSKRIEQVNELIQRELGRVILREIDFPPGIMVTITRVETSVDLGQSKVYVSVFPEGKTESALGILARNIYDIQQGLNKRLKMRIIPRIFFAREKETAEAGRIESLLEQLKNKRK
ncbi:MAG: 30S ribosome-binding factor RbfA [bacterium]|nr:30S ribosome-binding factor RbfA [bacterium]